MNSAYAVGPNQSHPLFYVQLQGLAPSRYKQPHYMVKPPFHGITYTIGADQGPSAFLIANKGIGFCRLRIVDRIVAFSADLQLPGYTIHF
ncbi:hypothetical protein SAMN05421676_101104 [Salinibacillus kushneri]|uniref:Uncharacterized protein n=1 Tax=Salinibacillus kushneri TaxID=237682 RepID=A0A1H9YBL7_9BACI|nr:hypothetical protein SAMN05421676_101104 [Salinibacillus kushneri]